MYKSKKLRFCIATCPKYLAHNIAGQSTGTVLTTKLDTLLYKLFDYHDFWSPFIYHNGQIYVKKSRNTEC